MQRLIVAMIRGLFLIGGQAFALPAAADSLETLEKECHTQLNLGPSGCECIAARAEEVLNEDQQALVAAMVSEDQATSDTLRGQMTLDELTGAANFMMSAPQVCAAQ
jgi:hypothetical protein